MTRTSLTRAAALRRKLRAVLLPRCGATLGADEVRSLGAEIVAILPDGIRIDTIVHSLADLSGRVLDEAGVHSLVWRLAGNVSRLRCGSPVLPWTAQTCEEWLPLRIVDVAPASHSGAGGTMLGADMTFLVQAGLPAGLLVTRFWSRSAAWHASLRLGFSRRVRRRRRSAATPSPLMVFRSFMSFFGMRLRGLFTPESCARGLNFAQISCSASDRNWNRGLLRKRARIDFACPMRWNLDCTRCPIGASSCQAGCHQDNFTAGSCVRCGKRGWMNVRWSAQVCVACWTARFGFV